MAKVKIQQVISDLSGQEIPEGDAYEMTVKLPNGRTQRIDLSGDEFKSLGLDGKGVAQKRRGRKPRNA